MKITRIVFSLHSFSCQSCRGGEMINKVTAIYSSRSVAVPTNLYRKSPYRPPLPVLLRIRPSKRTFIMRSDSTYSYGIHVRFSCISSYRCARPIEYMRRARVLSAEDIHLWGCVRCAPDLHGRRRRCGQRKREENRTNAAQTLCITYTYHLYAYIYVYDIILLYLCIYTHKFSVVYRAFAVLRTCNLGTIFVCNECRRTRL